MLKGLVFESLPFLPKTTPIQQRGAREQGAEVRSCSTRITPTARAMSFLFSGRVRLSKCAYNFSLPPLSTLTDADDKPYNYLLRKRHLGDKRGHMP